MSVEKHPDLLRRQQLLGPEEEEEWEEYQRLLGEFEKGVRFVLRRSVIVEVMHDLVSECFALYMQDCGKWSPQSYGKDAAHRWLEKHFTNVKLPTSEGETDVWKEKSPMVGSLARQNYEGEPYNVLDNIAADPALEPEGWMGKKKDEDAEDSFLPKNYTLFRATADYEICLQYMERMGRTGNCFTPAERTAYKSAMRRLRKLAHRS